MIRRVFVFREYNKDMNGMIAMIIAFVTGGLGIAVLSSASQVVEARLSLN
jgi:hypothetical protein